MMEMVFVIDGATITVTASDPVTGLKLAQEIAAGG